MYSVLFLFLSRMKTRKQKQNHIDHHHLFVRMETLTCPLECDKARMASLLKKLLKEIGMKPLDDPHVYYQKTPKWNEGCTGIAPITTSHMAFHFWRYPQKQILQNPMSHCLLQFDVYTCGSLTKSQIQSVLQQLTQFGPTHLDAMLINRKRGVKVDLTLNWDLSDSTWEKFCST